MAIHDEHDLAPLLGVPEDSPRLENFVWVYLAHYGGFPEVRNASGYPRALCWEILKNQVGRAQTIKSTMLQRKIPEWDLKWVIDDERQAFWIQRVIGGLLLSPHATAATGPSGSSLVEAWIPRHLRGVQRSIALLDFWASHSHTNLDHHAIKVREMASAWSAQEKADSVFAWVGAEDGDYRRAVFVDHLRNQYGNSLIDFVSPNSHADFLNFMTASGIHPSELILVGQKVKRFLQQQKRRANSKGKRQCNFVLQEKTVTKLEKLAERFGISKTEIVELLIQAEAENPLHTTERQRRISALTGQV